MGDNLIKLEDRQKNKRKKWKLIPFLVLLLVAISGGTFYIIHTYIRKDNKKQADYVKPDRLFEDYVEFLRKSDYARMYEMLDDESRLQISKDAFITRNQKIYGDIKADQIEMSVNRVKELEDGGALLNYSMTMQTVAGELSFDNQIQYFMTKGKGYSLRWNDGVIFPDLEETDEVVVSKSQAKRGSIFDRNGITLAGWGKASVVGLVPGEVTGEVDKKRISELLNISLETMDDKLNAAWVDKDTFVPIKTLEKVNELELLAEEPDREMVENDRLQKELLSIKGVQINDIEIRNYPLKDITSHITGYVQNITEEELKELGEFGYDKDSVIGKSGLEKALEEELRGKDGCEVNIVTGEGEEKQLLAYQVKKDGSDVHLTIDSELQKVLYKGFKGDNGCSVAMNPRTGEVLALVSTPSFDPNAFVLGMTEAEWKGLSEDVNKPMWSRFTATWCPGSVIKPVIAAIGVQTGDLEPNRDYGKEGRKWQKDESWGGYYVTTLQTYDDVRMVNALIYSDNIFFAKTALRIGADKLMEQLTRLGFGETVPFDLGMSQSKYSNGETIESEVQLADSGYGQGQMLVNPLHLASMYSAFINDGNMVAPYIKQKESGGVEYWKEGVFSKETAGLVKDALVQVVENPKGTASACRMDGIRLAGKTGTAEIKAAKENESGTEVGWLSVFTAESETEDSLLLISMVDDVKESGGSSYVVGKDKKVLKWYFSNDSN